ncbi:MAG: alkyl sulfatase dimerization domain-containing protein, partial [Blastomonas fulva]|uniref:alkyl sulfatase dimerization domain-containing protein n=1 Tax=Blastomonas fulva TaxID=1550728 RepID=UPI0040334EF6
VHELMRDVKLPENLTIGEFHGKVSWSVKTIWEEYSGWFHYEDGTTELYHVPRSAVNDDLVMLAGGPSALAHQASVHVIAGRPLEAIHLLDIALDVEPAHRESLGVKKQALTALLDASGSRNLSETMWLKSEIAAVDQSLTAD